MCTFIHFQYHIAFKFFDYLDMCPINTEDLNRIFEKLDKNGDGFVSLDELKWLLETIGVRASQDELRSLVGKKSLDLIDFMLFYDTIIKQNINGEDELGKDEVLQDNNLENDLAKAFDVYDVNGDGYISCEELQSVLLRLGFWNDCCGRDCRSMIKRYDMNSDGVLDFEEFKNMMLLTNS